MSKATKTVIKTGCTAIHSNQQSPTIDEFLASIAKVKLRIDTLETRNSDSLDFHEVAVWSLKDCAPGRLSRRDDGRAGGARISASKEPPGFASGQFPVGFRPRRPLTRRECFMPTTNTKII